MATVYTQRRVLLGPGFVLFTLAYSALLTVCIVSEKWIFMAALAGVPCLFFWPVELSIGLFAFFVPIETISLLNEHAGTTLNWYLGLAAGLILLASGLVRDRLQRPPRAALWWSLFVGWSAASVLWAVNSRTALQRLATAVALLLLYLVTVSFRMSKQELLRVASLAVLGGCTSAILAISQFYRGAYFHANAQLTADAQRSTLIFGGRETDPNVFAATLLLPISLAMGGFLSFRRRAARAALLGIGTMMVYALLLTMSRGGLLALVVMLLVFLYRLRLGWKSLFLAAVMSTLLLALPAAFFSRVQHGLSSRGSGRFDIWQAGWSAFQHHGVAGVGLDNFREAYREFAGHADVFLGENRDPHNIYLEVGVELGGVGLALLLAAFCSQLQAAHRELNHNYSGDRANLVTLEASCWALLVSGLSLDILWLKVFWLAWMLLAIAVRIQKEVRVDAGRLAVPPLLTSVAACSTFPGSRIRRSYHGDQSRI